GPALCGVNMEFVIPIDAKHSLRTAMNHQQHGIFFAGLPAEGLDEESVDGPAVRALVSQALDGLQLELRPQVAVDMGQLPFAGAVEIRDVKIVEMLEIVCEVNHFFRALTHVESVNVARTGGHGAESVPSGIRAKDVRFAFYTSGEKNRAGSRPVQIPGNQIEG